MIFLKIKSRTLQDILKVLLGNFIAQGIGFLTVIVVSRDLGPEHYGIFSLLLAIFITVNQISDFGISTSYVKYVSENLSKAENIFMTVILSKMVLSVPVISIFFFSSEFISNFFFDTNRYESIIKIIATAVFFHAIFSVVLAHFQAVQNFKVFAYLNITHNLLKFLSVIIIAFAFSKEKHLEYFIFVYTFSVVFLILIVGLSNYRIFKVEKFDFFSFVRIYKLGFWVFLSSLAVMVMMRLDIMMLQKMSTSAEVGYYSAAMNLAMIFPLITNSIVTTLLPKMGEFLKKHTVEEYFKNVFHIARYVVIFLALVEFLSPIMIKIIFGEQYIGSISILQILLIAFIIGVIINPISLVVYTLNKAYVLTVMNWIQLLLNYFGNLLLIPILQGDGAAISTTIVKVCGGVFIMLYVLRYGDVKPY